MTETSSSQKSLVEQILEDTFQRIENSDVFDATNVAALRKLAAEGSLNRESIAAALSTKAGEASDEDSGT